MHLELYRTTLAAAPRLPNEFGVPRLRKITNISLRSRAGGNSTNSQIKKRIGKKKPFSSSRNPKLRQTYQEHGETERRPKPFFSTPVDEPFDICPFKMGRNYVNKQNRQMWSPKIQSPKENEENNVIFEEGSNTEDLVEVSGLVLRHGMVLFKHYIPLLEQVKIVSRCRELGCGPGGFYQPGHNNDAKMRLYMMCLGWDWNHQTRKYGERRHHDNAAPPHLPDEFISLVSRALDDSHNLIGGNLMVENAGDVLPKMTPDVCTVNFYSTNGRLGLHQDRDESKKSLREGLPIVSISIGDTAKFLYGDESDVTKAKSIFLESGDVLIFGGESRHIFHGVSAITPGSAPPALVQSTGLRLGRLNLTFRKL